MEWSDVRIFLAVARAGTLGGAARALRLSHPTVGRRLRALEEATGQTLFQRTADGFVLTEEGSAIVALAEQMEEGALAMERRLAGQEQNLRGCLRISSADIAFRIVPFNTSDIVQRRLTRLNYGVYIAASAPDPLFGDGTGFRLITHDTSTEQFPDIAWLMESFPNATPVIRSNNRNVQARMCRRGASPSVPTVGNKTPGLRLLDLPAEPPHLDIAGRRNDPVPAPCRSKREPLAEVARAAGTE